MAFLLSKLMHIEVTSRCVLDCPACARTWFVGKFKRSFPKHDLNLNDLEKFLDCESGSKETNFLLNGNHGDPIYYPHLLDMFKRFRNKNFSISTNGSYQKSNFWHELADLVTSHDTIFFSIDGLEEDNHLYRRNADWKSIMMGLDIMCRSQARIIWKTLIFQYNQDKIDLIKNFAESKGAIFHVDITERFGDESLKPKDVRLVDTSRLYQYHRDVIDLQPRCDILKYISADGYFWPCCMITTVQTLYQTDLWKHRNKWSIRNQNLDQAMNHLLEWKQQILSNPRHAHAQCKMHCKPGQKFDWMLI